MIDTRFSWANSEVPAGIGPAWAQGGKELQTQASLSAHGLVSRMERPWDVSASERRAQERTEGAYPEGSRSQAGFCPENPLRPDVRDD